MLTQEQIKSLKPGDPVIIEATFCKLDYDGDVVSETTWTTRGVSENCKIIAATSRVSLPSEHGTLVPTPQYDPTRLFKKGDKVRVVECKGRNYTGRKTGDIGTVDRNESPGTAEVEVEFADEDMWEIDPAYLELVTPIEEREPYYVELQGEKKGGLCYTVRKHGGYAESIFYFGKCRSRDEQQAKAAAEAERDRLNAEWRKEQNND